MISKRLLQLGAKRVNTFDIRAPDETFLKTLTPAHRARLHSYVGDITRLSTMLDAFGIPRHTSGKRKGGKGKNVPQNPDPSRRQPNLIKVDGVFHIASFGMSGRDQLDRKRVYSVNVRGTQNVIKCCLYSGTKRLVYTSTYNVVFGGSFPEPIIKGAEDSCEYLPTELHCDEYSRTKAAAEQLVLRADGQRMRTASIRPAGIYGPGEERHFPRIINMIQRGLFAFTVGPRTSRVDFVYIDNLVESHILACRKLTGSSSRQTHLTDSKMSNKSSDDSNDDPWTSIVPAGPSAGQAYFISDGEPINNFEFFRPLVEGFGHKYPSISVPYWIMFYVAHLIEIIHSIVHRVYNFQPLLTRAEVNKIAVTHFFSINRARQDLGYKPLVCYKDGIQKTVTHYLDTYASIAPPRTIGMDIFLIMVVIAIAVLAVFAGKSFVL
jgi:nucleoside-diphosphate-sugar epimerase